MGNDTLKRNLLGSVFLTISRQRTRGQGGGDKKTHKHTSIRIPTSGMTNQIALIRLRKSAEASNKWEVDRVSQKADVEIEIVERGQQIRGVEAGGHGVLQVVCLSGIGVGEVADVALEGRVPEEGFYTVVLRGFGVSFCGLSLVRWVLLYVGEGFGYIFRVLGNREKRNNI